MFFIVSAGLVLALFIYVAALGTYYIRFDGETYTVWIRRFLGYDDILGGAYRLKTEEAAKEKIATAKKNPPRIINP